MNINNSLKVALALYESGDFYESIAICNKLLTKKSNLFSALELQALNLQHLNRTSEAIVAFEQAIKLKPKHAGILNCYGNLYLQLHQYDKASQYFIKSISLDMSTGKALGNLAVCQQRNGHFDEAEKSLKKAMLLDATSASFHLKLGLLYTEIGRFDSAINMLLKSLELDPSQGSVYFYAYTVMMYKHRYQDAIQVADMGLISQTLTDIELCELLVAKAIVYWLFGEMDNLKQTLALSEGIYSDNSNYANIINLKTFHTYLKKLLSYRLTNPDFYQIQAEEELFFISESHGFSPCGLTVNYKNKNYQVRSLFIRGAKAYHFSVKQNNKFKESLNILLQGLPSKSKLVFAFGEIDCRRNEGFFKHSQQTGGTFSTVIKDVVDSYLHYLISLTSPKGHEVLLYGVPAPHPRQVACLPDEKQEEFKQLISLFNICLEERCDHYGFTFLNVYQLTNLEGESDLTYHLDDFHVKPEVTQLLFNKLSY